MRDSTVGLAERRVAVGRPIAATAAVFFVNGLLFASWTVHIPQVKDRLGLTDATGRARRFHEHPGCRRAGPRSGR